MKSVNRHLVLSIPAQLQVILERCEKAKATPWRAFFEGRDFVGGSDVITTFGEDLEPSQHFQSDLDFLAYARNCLPKLIEALLTENVDSNALGALWLLCSLARPGPWRVTSEQKIEVENFSAKMSFHGATDDDLAFIAHARSDLPFVLYLVSNGGSLKIEDYIARIERRTNAATPEPWRVCGDSPATTPGRFCLGKKEISVTNFGWQDIEFLCGARSRIPSMLNDTGSFTTSQLPTYYLDCAVASHCPWRQVEDGIELVLSGQRIQFTGMEVADLEFAAHARNDLPFLAYLLEAQVPERPDPKQQEPERGS